MSADPVILKILGGMQAGVEVALADGTYLLGSGPDDDIQLVDVSLLPGHVRLRIASGKVEIAAQAGTAQTASGDALAADQGWRALEPLEAVTVGTTRLALGPRSANWASVAEDGARGSVRSAVGPDDPPGPAPAAPAASRARALALPVAAVVAAALLAGWYLATGGHLPSSRAARGQDLQVVRTALDAFPFGTSIESRQDVDGAIYITGYVEAPVQRRALAGALERTDVDVHLRLFVLESMRREIAALIGAEKLPVTFSVSDKGEVTLDGLVLQPARERKLVSEIDDTVVGVHGVVSHIRTGDTLLDGVRQLVASSGLKSWLLLRRDGDVIEVSGALPTDKVDAWVGFLQTYATRFSDEISLRSFVQLQTPNGRLTPAPGVPSALALGTGQAGAGDTAMNVERLRRGDFKLGDIFVDPSPAGPLRGPSTLGTSAEARDSGKDAAPRRAAGTVGLPAGATAALLPRPATGLDGAPAGDARRGPAPAGPALPRPAASLDGAPAGDARRGPALTGALPPRSATSSAGEAGRGPAQPDDAQVRRADGAAVRQPPGSGGDPAPDARTGTTRTDASQVREGADRPNADPARSADAARPEATGSRDGLGSPAPTRAESAPPERRAAAPDRPGGREDGPAPVLAASRSGAPPAIGSEAVALVPPSRGSAAGGEAAPPLSPALDTGRLTTSAALQTVPETLTAQAPAGEGRASEGLAQKAVEVLKSFQAGRGGDDDAEQAIDRALALLGSASNGVAATAAGPKIADWYLPLFVDPAAPRAGSATCWDGTALTADDVLPVLFWLDVLSASRLVSLAAFDQTQQALLIEAALNPREILACSRRTPVAARAADHSLYLREVSRNPGFVGFVLRDLPASDLDVAGASLGRRRFIITRAGVRMTEGAAPDRGSRLAVVGELGLALQHQDGLSVLVFGPDIAWVVAN